MRLTVLGGCGAWPAPGTACGGYLIEQEGFRLLIDPGYATLPRLPRQASPELIDAVFISHGHPDHCADLNPLLRARALADHPAAPLPVYTLPGAVDAVLALDRPGMLDDAYALREFSPGDHVEIGPFHAETRLLPHWVPNVGVRLAAGDRVVSYTGDAGPSDDLLVLAHRADLLLAEASYVEHVPKDSERHLSSAGHRGTVASRAGAGRLLLTHLWPGTDPAAAREAASMEYQGDVAVATHGLVVDL